MSTWCSLQHCRTVWVAPSRFFLAGCNRTYDLLQIPADASQKEEQTASAACRFEQCILKRFKSNVGFAQVKQKQGAERAVKNQSCTCGTR